MIPFLNLNFYSVEDVKNCPCEKCGKVPTKCYRLTNFIQYHPVDLPFARKTQKFQPRTTLRLCGDCSKILIFKKINEQTVQLI